MSLEALYQRLLAEAETWPLASEAGFHARTIHLGREKICTLDASTQDLAESLERHLRIRSGGMSLGSLERLRDGAWFGQQAPAVSEIMSIADYTVGLSRRYLEQQGADIVLRRDGTRLRSIVLGHWRWFSLRVPADLLVSALASGTANDPSSDYVSLSSEVLREVLKKPVAETHLHANAAFSFPMLWTTWSRWFSKKTPDLSRLGIHELPFNSPSEFVRMLMRAFLARLLLGQFLSRTTSGAAETFRQFLLGESLKNLCETATWEQSTNELAHLCRSGLSPFLPKNMHEEWIEPKLDGMSEVPQTPGENGPSTEKIRSAYSALVVAHTETITTQREAIVADPLERWFRTNNGRALPESRFACRAFRYLQGTGRGDDAFATAFWQYQRIRCLAFRFLVEEAGTAGLDWFQRHFARLDSLRSPLEPMLSEATFESTRRGLNLSALELRLHPGDPERSMQTLRKGISAVLASSSRWECTPEERPELGLVFHFIKERYAKRNRAKPHADPSIGGFRFADWFKNCEKQSVRIESLLDQFPSLLMVVRGIDIAGSELAVPTWATVEILTHLRRKSFHIARKNRRRHPEWRLGSLRVTYHAGEEYQRLVEGLRRIHELIQFSVLRFRDRLGHGLALGADVTEWIRDAPVAFQPVEDRLDDLLWELERYDRTEVSVSPGRQAVVEQLVRQLAEEIYGGSPSRDALLEARRLRHWPRYLRRLGFPNEPRPRESLSDESSHLLHRYLTDPNVYQRGQRLVEVTAGEYGEDEFLRKVQTWLKTKLVQRGITIEVNPTSNLLIANLQGMGKHPLLGLTAEPNGPKFSINSDDPLTFATTLSDEYSYLYGEFEDQAPVQAQVHIDLLRANGWNSRFTVPDSAKGENLLKLCAELSMNEESSKR